MTRETAIPRAFVHFASDAAHPRSAAFGLAHRQSTTSPPTTSPLPPSPHLRHTCPPHNNARPPHPPRLRARPPRRRPPRPLARRARARQRPAPARGCAPPPPAPPPGTNARRAGFSKGYFVSIAAVVATIAAYKLDVNSSVEGQTFLQRTIEKYTSGSKVWEARTSVHTAMIEQAATDRMLFHDQPRRTTIILKNTEYVLPRSGGDGGGDGGQGARLMRVPGASTPARRTTSRPAGPPATCRPCAPTWRRTARSTWPASPTTRRARPRCNRSRWDLLTFSTSLVNCVHDGGVRVNCMHDGGVTRCHSILTPAAATSAAIASSV